MPERLHILDTHMHSIHSEPLDRTKLAPVADMMQASIDVGLTGGLLTDHNTMAGMDEWLDLAAKYGFLSAPAVEVDSLDPYTGKRPHIIGVFSEWPIKGKLPFLNTPETTFKMLNDMGAFVIIPHPISSDTKIHLVGDCSLAYWQIARWQHLIHAVETTTLLTTASQAFIDYLTSVNIISLGSTDAHFPQLVGHVKTHVSASSDNMFDLLHEVRDQHKPTAIERPHRLTSLLQSLPLYAQSWMIWNLTNYGQKSLAENSGVKPNIQAETVSLE